MKDDFQIVLEFLESDRPEVAGRAATTVSPDFREKLVKFAAGRCTEEEREMIETVVEQRTFNGVTHAEILGILEHHDSLDWAAARATQYAESARKAICTFPDTEIKRALLWAPDFVVAREK